MPLIDFEYRATIADKNNQLIINLYWLPRGGKFCILDRLMLGLNLLLICK